MVKEHQQRYLNTLPDNDRKAEIFPFNSKTKKIAQDLINKIKEALPSSEVFYQGSTYLEIAGENDIDLSIIYTDFDLALEKLVSIFGQPVNTNNESKYAHWDFTKEGFAVDMGLQSEMTPMLEEQLKTQQILEENDSLKKEYELMKLDSNGIPWKDYLIKKYEFWNRVTD